MPEIPPGKPPLEAPEEPDEEYFRKGSPHFDVENKEQKVIFLQNLTYCLALWLDENSQTVPAPGVHPGEEDRLIPMSIMRPRLAPRREQLQWWVLKTYIREKRSLQEKRRRSSMLLHCVRSVRNAATSSRKAVIKLLFNIRMTFWSYMRPMDRAYGLRHHRTERNKKDLNANYLYVILLFCIMIYISDCTVIL